MFLNFRAIFDWLEVLKQFDWNVVLKLSTGYNFWREKNSITKVDYNLT
jgi:hypothetical protein